MFILTIHAKIKVMKSRDGFAVPLVIFLVLALVVVGGILYVHYVYLPKMAAQNSNTNQPAPITSSVTANIVSSSTTSTPIQPAGEAKQCMTSMDCFIAAAQTCTPATVEWTSTSTLFQVFTQTSQAQLKLGGLNSAGTCSFSDHVNSLTLSITPQNEQEWESVQGVTAAQIQQQLQTTQAQEQSSVGSTLTCPVALKTLVQALTAWSSGAFSFNDLNAENCIVVSATGTKSYVSTSNY
jgi:biopolymer transport protein ExbD